MEQVGLHRGERNQPRQLHRVRAPLSAEGDNARSGGPRQSVGPENTGGGRCQVHRVRSVRAPLSRAPEAGDGRPGIHGPALRFAHAGRRSPPCGISGLGRGGPRIESCGFPAGVCCNRPLYSAPINLLATRKHPWFPARQSDVRAVRDCGKLSPVPRIRAAENAEES